MDMKKVFNDLVEVPQNENKHKIVAEEWKELRDLKDPATFESAVEAKKREWKQLNLTSPTETSANIITEVDLTSTTKLEVSSEDAACLPVPEVLYDYFFGLKIYVVLRNQISCIVKYTLF